MKRFAIVGLALVACGGGEPETAPAEEEETSGEEIVTAEPEDEYVEEEYVEPEPEPERSGPGQLTVINEIEGQDVGGTVQVLDLSGEVVAEGQSGETFNLDSGTYRLVGTVTDESVLIDTPTREGDRRVTLEPADARQASVEHHRSRIKLRVERRGRVIPRWRFEATREGTESTVTIEPHGDFIPITAGRWTGTLHANGGQMQINVFFPGGARQTLPITID